MRPWTAISTPWCFRSDTPMGVSSIEPHSPSRQFLKREKPGRLETRTPAILHQTVANRHRRDHAWLDKSTRCTIAGGGTRSRVRRLCIVVRSPTSTRINYFLSTGGGSGADTMRCATLATMGTPLLLAGCANGWFRSPSPPAAARASSVASPAAERRPPPSAVALTRAASGR